MNRVALITGGSRGIGRGIALELAKSGYDVVINYFGNETAAHKTAGECIELGQSSGKNIQAVICKADISVANQRAGLIEFTRKTFDRLDLLVNNAGIAPSTRADILEASEESFDRLLAVNVKGPYFLTQLAAKWMIEQAGGQDPCGVRSYRPKVVTITSISAFVASTNRGDYCVSKAALSMITPLYAARLSEHGVGVFEIRPGIIATDMTEPVKAKYDRLIAGGLTPIRRWGTPEDVGRAVVAIAQDLFPYSTGDVFNVDGGFHLRTL